MPQFQDAMSPLKLVGGTSTNWIVGAVPPPRFVPGSPVFNFAGELAALETSVLVDSNAVACPSQWIVELLKNLAPLAAPFPVDADIAEALSTVEEFKQRLPAPESPAFETAQQLQQKVQAIAQFNFLPRTQEQFQALGDFADITLRLDGLLQSDALTEVQRQEAQAFLDEALDSFQSQLQQAVSEHPENVAANNHSAGEFAAGERGFAAFGEVVRNGMQSAENAPFAIFRLPDYDQHVFTPIQYDGPIFIPGSRWLLIGKSSPKLNYRSTDGITIIDARVCEIRYVFSLAAAEQK